jgi:hypothetical protein
MPFLCKVNCSFFRKNFTFAQNQPKTNNMRKMYAVAAAAVILLLNACAPSVQSDGVWVNKDKIQGKSFKKIFIVVMSDNIEARSRLETDLADAATARGYEAVKSMDVMPPSLTDNKKPTKEDVVSKVKGSGCDAVFMASLLRKEENVHYVPGTTAYTMMPYYTWSGNYFGYYNNWYPTVHNPGYYQKEKSYFMQSNLYDAATEELMWSVQSEVFNPSSLNNFSKSYMNTLVKQLTRQNLLKKS